MTIGISLRRADTPQSAFTGAFLRAALIFCAAAAAYFPAMGGKRIVDDGEFLTQPRLQSLAGLGRIWFDVGATDQYYPALHTAFWVEHLLWGDSLWAYHLLNVLLHATAACLFVLVLRQLRVPGAYFAGLVFALHPVCVESVAWISEQKNTLSSVFYLLAALTYLRWSDSAARAAQLRLYLLASGFFLLALLSKSVTATLPAALLVVFWWRQGRLSWKQQIVPLVPWCCLGAAAGLFTSWVERDLIGAKGGGFAMSFINRGLVAGRAVWFYLGKLLWPTHLIFIYPRWRVDSTAAGQYLFPSGLLALLTVLWLLRRRSRAPLATALIFAGTLFPALGFLNVYFFIYSFVADHFQYLAALSIIALVAAGWARWAATGGAVTRVAAVAALGVLGALTWRQCRMYRDAETLYRSILAENPDCWMAHNNLGVAWLNTPGRLNDAIAQYQEVLRLKPDAEAHYNLGSAFLKIPERLPDAIAQFEEALRLRPDYAEAHNNLGSAWSRIPGRLPDAVAQFEEALRLVPDYAEAHDNLGSAYVKIPGRLPDAIAQCEEALRLSPNYPQAHNNLGNAYSRMPGRSTQARTHYEEALRLDPNYAEAHNNLANLLATEAGRQSEAIEQYEIALRLRPAFPEAHYDLANVLAAEPGREAEALAQYEEALRLRPDYAEAHNNLGAALIGIPGRQADAIAHFEAALRLKPNYIEASLNLAAALRKLRSR